MPLDTVLAERLYKEETPAHISADQAYDRRWALALLEQTLGRLRAEFERSGKSEEFTILKQHLITPQNGRAYTEIAVQLGSTEGAARVAVHRMRKRFREIFREEIAQTVSDGQELEDEIRHLIEVLAQGSAQTMV